MHSQVRDRLEEAVQLLRQATVIDSRCALAYVLLARCLGYLISSSSAERTANFAELGTELVSLARIAVECGKDDPEVLANAGLIIGQGSGDLNSGIALIEKSLMLHPHSIDGLTLGGILYAHLGSTEKAVDYLQRAERVNPVEGSYIRSWAMAFAYFVEGSYQLALPLLSDSLRENPTYLAALRLRAAICGLVGEQEDARSTVQRLLRLAPDWTVSRTRKFLNFVLGSSPNKQDLLDRFSKGLRLAGLPE